MEVMLCYIKIYNIMYMYTDRDTKVLKNNLKFEFWIFTVIQYFE